MRKPRSEIRDQQICLYLSEDEKNIFDHLCDYYGCSRPDFVRTAFYIAANDPPVFLSAKMRAEDEGCLTGTPNRRLK